MRSLANNFLLDGLDNNSISENVQELDDAGVAAVGGFRSASSRS